MQSMGLWDRLFGEKMQVELGDGRKVTVTRKWLEDKERKGLARNVTDEQVRVHLLRPVAAAMFDALGGTPIPTYQQEIWAIGEDVSVEEVSEYRDGDTGDLYAMVMSKLDRSTMKFNIKPELYTREYWNEQAEMNGVEPR